MPTLPLSLFSFSAAVLIWEWREGEGGGRGEALILSCQLSFSHFTPLGSNPLLHLFLSLVLGEILVCILFGQFECYKIPLEIIDRAKRSQKYLTKKSCMLWLIPKKKPCTYIPQMLVVLQRASPPPSSPSFPTQRQKRRAYFQKKPPPPLCHQDLFWIWEGGGSHLD